MIKSIIIDNDPDCVELVRGLLTAYCPQVDVVLSCSTIKEAVAGINELQPQLLFLDIELNDENGFDLFKFFPKPKFQVIFTTSHAEFAVKAIKSSCLDFILKPVDPAELVEAVNRVNLSAAIDTNIPVLIDNLQNQQKKVTRLVIPSQNNYTVVDIKDITCLEGDGRYTTIYTIDGQKTVVTTNLGEYEHMLDKDIFYRAHKSFMVNINFVQKFMKNESIAILPNNVQAAVSTRKKDEFLKMLFQGKQD